MAGNDKFFGESSSPTAHHAYAGQEALSLADGLPMEGLALGPYNSSVLLTDPKRFGFILARHKFVAKMLQGMDRVLEVGCQEGIGTMLIGQAVGHVVATDFYRPHIESCQARLAPVLRNATFKGWDILDGPVPGGFDGAFSLDVLEHIDGSQEDLYMRHIADSLGDDGVFIVGTPSLESQEHASAASRASHINCKTGEQLRDLGRRFYRNVFMFGMNDEVLHTGFMPMCHYLFGMFVGPRR